MKAFNAWPFALMAAATFAGSRFCTVATVDRVNDELAIAGGTDRSSLSDRAQTVKSSPVTKIVVNSRAKTIRNLFVGSCMFSFFRANGQCNGNSQMLNDAGRPNMESYREYDLHRIRDLMVGLGVR